MLCVMNPVKHIRECVFRQTQSQFAVTCGTTQATISRWEDAGRVPSHKQLAVRDAAKLLELNWDDRWFFQVPTAIEPAAQ